MPRPWFVQPSAWSARENAFLTHTSITAVRLRVRHSKAQEAKALVACHELT